MGMNKVKNIFFVSR